MIGLMNMRVRMYASSPPLPARFILSRRAYRSDDLLSRMRIVGRGNERPRHKDE